MTSSVQDILLLGTDVVSQNGSESIRTPLSCHKFVKDLIYHERTQFAIQSFGTYTPFIIVSFIAFIYSSSFGLRFYIALQRTPIPYRSETDVKKRKGLMIALVMLYVAECFLMVVQPKLANTALAVLIWFMIYSASCSFIEQSSNLISLAASRSPHGAPCLRVVKKQRVNRILIRIASALVATGANVLRIGILSWAGFSAIVFTFACIYISKIRFGVALLTIYAFALIVSQVEVLASTQLHAAIDFISNSNNRIPNLNFFWTWVFPSVMIALPGVILSHSLRFDYQQHVGNHPEALNISQDLQTIAPRETFGNFFDRVGSGVVLPSKAPTGFRKIYFKTALAAWLTSQSVMLTIAMLVKGHRHDSPTAVYLLLFLPLGLQMMLGALVIRARMRGELKMLLQYREFWKLKPIPLPAITVTIPDEEKDDDIVVKVVEV